MLKKIIRLGLPLAAALGLVLPFVNSLGHCGFPKTPSIGSGGKQG